jgi:hypothetical protein
MSSLWGDAKAIMGAVAVLSAAPTLLWMASNMGSASIEQMAAGLGDVVVTVAKPAIVITAVLAGLLWIFSLGR